jgi:hypothetical protein
MRIKSGKCSMTKFVKDRVTTFLLAGGLRLGMRGIHREPPIGNEGSRDGSWGSGSWGSWKDLRDPGSI